MDIVILKACKDYPGGTVLVEVDPELADEFLLKGLAEVRNPPPPPPVEKKPGSGNPKPKK